MIRQPIAIPKEMGAVHHEIELAVLIGQPLKQANEDRLIVLLLVLVLV